MTIRIRGHPATASLIADGRTAIVTMAIGALAGALVSWRLAMPLMGKVTRLEQEIIAEQRRAA